MIRGDDQYDKDVKLKVVVDNLTTNCKVAVNWLAFLFKEDGQPSSAGLDAPPGADPDTSVGPGQTYVHIFTFTEVKTYVNRGTPVLHEVKPEVVLQCPGVGTGASSASQLSAANGAIKKDSRTADTRAPASRQAAEAIQGIAELLQTSSAFKTTAYSAEIMHDLSYSYDNVVVDGCKISFVSHVRDLTDDKLIRDGKGTLDFKGKPLDIQLRDLPLKRGNPEQLVGYIYDLSLTQYLGEFERLDYDSGAKESRDHLAEAAKMAVEKCGGPPVHVIVSP